MSIASRLFPRLHPSLPQNDSPATRRQRRKQLQQSRQTYRWTDQLQNVVGVPMSAEVPFADEPSLPWLLLVAETGLKIAENFVLVKLENAQRQGVAADPSAQQRLADIRAKLAHTQVLKASHTDEAKAGIAQEALSAAKHAAAMHADSFEEMLVDFKSLVAQFEQQHGRGDALAEYEGLFKSLALPAVAGDFMQDASFVRYRIAGPNPMLIRAVSALPPSLPLSDAQYRAVMGADDGLADALAAHRIYLLDYRELDALAAAPGNSNGRNKYVFAPIALFALPKAGGMLRPVTIQCGQNPSQHPLFFPAEAGSAGGWGWQMAKTVVQVADCNYHELFVHLARTHLVMEAFAVATRRCLADAHPLNALLVPHFFGTLFINNAAASSLIAPGGPIDHIFGAPIADSQKAAGSDRLAFDFDANMLPADLAARGVADSASFPDYPYRDDALLLWSAIAQWAQDYVAVYYVDDAAVTGDTELADWHASLVADGKITGLAPIATRARLAEVLTMLIFIATAQHSAVNFPQKPLMTYAPAISGAGWSEAPASQPEHREQDWLALLPSPEAALEQLNILYLLGSVHYRALGDYRSNDFPYLPWFEDRAVTGDGGPLERFQATLRNAQTTIAQRNQARIPYSFLLPDGIPNSINI
jgi:arachidonate 15-lipoxygenase